VGLPKEGILGGFGRHLLGSLKIFLGPFFWGLFGGDWAKGFNFGGEGLLGLLFENFLLYT